MTDAGRIAVTGDDGYLTLACFAADPDSSVGDTIHQIDAGDTWDGLATAVGSHRCDVHTGPQERSPAVSVSPSHRFGRPAMNGVSTEMIADLHWAGGDVEDEYGLTRHELLVALWFEASQGQPRHRRRWKTWVDQAGPTLWKISTLDVAGVDIPPTGQDTP